MQRSREKKMWRRGEKDARRFRSIFRNKCRHEEETNKPGRKMKEWNNEEDKGERMEKECHGTTCETTIS